LKEVAVSQINVNTPEPVETVDTSGDRTAAAGINLVTVLIVLAVLAVIAWYLFTGPLHALGGGTTNINVNPAPTTVNVNPPGQSQPQPQAPAPAGNTGSTGGTTTNNAPAGGNPAPPKP
jgi:hypothetical protein